VSNFFNRPYGCIHQLLKH